MLIAVLKSHVNWYWANRYIAESITTDCRRFCPHRPLPTVYRIHPLSGIASTDVFYLLKNLLLIHLYHRGSFEGVVCFVFAIMESPFMAKCLASLNNHTMWCVLTFPYFINLFLPPSLFLFNHGLELFERYSLWKMWLWIVLHIFYSETLVSNVICQNEMINFPLDQHFTKD